MRVIDNKIMTFTWDDGHFDWLNHTEPQIDYFMVVAILTIGPIPKSTGFLPHHYDEKRAGGYTIFASIHRICGRNQNLQDKVCL